MAFTTEEIDALFDVIQVSDMEIGVEPFEGALDKETLVGVVVDVEYGDFFHGVIKKRGDRDRRNEM